MSPDQYPVRAEDLSAYQNNGYYYLGQFSSIGTIAYGSVLARPFPFENDTADGWANNACFRPSSRLFQSPSEDLFLVPTIPTGSGFTPRTYDNEEEEENWWNEHLRSGFKDPMWILDASSHSQTEKPTFVLPSLFQSPAIENASLPDLPLVADPSTGCPTTAVAKSPAPSSQRVNNHGAPRPPPGQLKRSSRKPPRVSSSSSQGKPLAGDGPDSLPTSHRTKARHIDKVVGKRAAAIKTRLAPTPYPRHGAPNAATPHTATGTPTEAPGTKNAWTIEDPEPANEGRIQVTLSNHTRRVVAGITYPEYLAIQSSHGSSITHPIPSPTEEPKKGQRRWRCGHVVNGVRCHHVTKKEEEARRHTITHESRLRWMCPSSLSTLKDKGWDENGVCLGTFARDSSADRHAKNCRVCKDHGIKKGSTEKEDIPSILISDGLEGVKLVRVVWTGEGAG
ncbi:hypothetical protein BU17DRAFT_71361 [Hysterangium stoloniferum]|nr:hypothetical protein BU17DRAFT_71361 [Hysterangium stoloniferum]